MRRKFYFCFTLLFLVNSLIAQNDVILNINHKLGNQNFEIDAPATNNLNNDFKVNRLEYYISKISFLDADDMEINTKEFIALLNTEDETTSSLVFENMDITSVKAVRFSIGVDPDRNHLDPATYPSDHPLAPKNPSMHWGWASGYRFIAMEGKGGNDFNQIFELHGLGDINYFQTEIPITAFAENGEIILDLEADYTRALEDITVSNGVIVHGEDGAARKALQNFRDHVFNISSGTTSTNNIKDRSGITNFAISPNPAINGLTTISISANEDLDYQINVTDLLGRNVQYFPNLTSNTSIDLQLDQPGFYFVSILKEGKVIATEKLWSN